MDIIKIVKVKEGQPSCKDYPLSIFLIPFRFNSKKIDQIKELLVNNIWNIENNLSDNEFFSHIKHLIDENQQSSICYRLKKSEADIIIRSKSENEDIGLINDAEIYLFKTGVGFYRISVCYKNVDNVKQLIFINNGLKSIAHNQYQIEIVNDLEIEFNEKAIVNHSQLNSVTAVDFTNKRSSIEIDKLYLPGLDENQDVKITYGDNKNKFVRYKSLTKLDLRDFINEELIEPRGTDFNLL